MHNREIDSMTASTSYRRALWMPRTNARQVMRLAKSILFNATTWIVILLLSFPLYWMIVTSLKPATELYLVPPELWPRAPTLDNYSRLLSTTNFLTYFYNSLFVAVTSTALAVLCGSLAGYSLSRFRLPIFEWYGRLVIVVKMLPASLIILPLFVNMVNYGFVNTPYALIAANTTFTLPLSIWLMKSYFDAIPVEIEESAWIDGCTRLSGFFRIVLPNAGPGLVAVAALNFISAWNEFLFALILISSESKRTLPLGLSRWISQDDLADWGMLLAAATLMTVPVLALYLLAQRKMVSGLLDGASKG